MDKNKIIQNAQKYVQKGQIDKAIREYSKIADADPKDVRTRLKIGDLHAKKGATAEAAATYMKVAEAYGQQGFFLKAVAVYKQILKLQPNLVDVNLKLADLYHQLGLMSDAMAQFQTVVGHFEAAGDSRSIFDTLRKMLDIDPDNVATRIKLAEMYSREGMVAEAVGEFKQAADWLKERNRIDDYVKVLERLAYHQPDDLPLTRELANIYLAKGDTKRSLAKLQICFKADPRDVETLHLLGQAFLELGQTAKTVSVYKEIAKIHGDASDIDEQRAAWKKVLELAPEDPEANAALGARREAAAVPSAGPPPGAAPTAGPPPGAAPTAGPPPGARPQAGPPPGAQPAAGPPPGAQAPPAAPPPGAAASAEAAASPAAAVAKLLTETDVYVKYGLHDKALEHLKKVFAIVPTHLEAHEKAKGLFESAGNMEAAGHELVTLIQLTIASEPDRARGYLKELATVAPHLPEYKGFVEKLGQPEQEQVSFIDQPAGVVEADDDDELVIAADDDEILVADESEGFTDEMGPDDDVFGVDIAQDEDIEIAAADDAGSFEDEEAAEADDAFVIDDELLADGDLDEAMADAEQSVGGGDDDGLEVDAGDMVIEDDVLDETAGDGMGLDDDTAGVIIDDGATLDDGDGMGLDDDTAGVIIDDAVSLDDAAPDDGDLLLDDGMVADVTVPEEKSPAARPEFDEIDDDSIDLDGATQMVPASDIEGLDDAADMDDLDDDEVTVHGAMPEPASLEAPAPADLEAPEPVEMDPPAAAEPEPEVAADTSADEDEPPAEAGKLPEEVADELEEAEFFLQQGLPDEAREVVEGVLAAAPGNADALALLAKIASEEGEDDLDVSEDTGELDGEAAPAGESSEDEEGDGFDAFDLAGELADELAEIESSDGGDSPLEDFQVSADDVFAEFKKGVAKAVGSEDAETHYDLGIAYREMGLTADAIGEFELAAAQPKKRVDALTMIGLCHKELGNLDGAIAAYESCLTEKGIKPDAAKAVHYDLGMAFEDKGEKPKAKRHFKKSVALDKGFRDAKARLDALADVEDLPEQRSGAASPKNGVPGGGDAGDAEKPRRARSSKTSKVGYV